MFFGVRTGLTLHFRMKPEKPTLKAIPWVNRKKFQQFMGNAALVATFSLPRRAEGAFYVVSNDGVN